MGINDRDYARGRPRSPNALGAMRMWSVNTWIIVINIAVFAIDALLASRGVLYKVVVGVQQITDPVTGAVMLRDVYQQMPPLQALFYFSTDRLFYHLEFWRLIGFQFLHGSIEHIGFNMLGLYFFGGVVEGYLGAKRYAAFYLTCGIFGGVSYLLLNLLGQIALHILGPGPSHIPGLLFTDMHTPLIGASAGVFGVLMAAAFILPNAQVLLFFILPMRLRTAAYGFTALAALNLLRNGQNAGGDAAHIGGALAGYYFIRHTHLLRDFFEILGPSSKKKGPSSASTPRGGEDQAELDRILAKVTTQGLHSLSDGERRTLRRATEARRG